MNPMARVLLPKLEWLFAFFALLVMSRGILIVTTQPLAVDAANATPEGSTIIQVVVGVIYLVVLLFILARFNEFIRLCRQNLPLIGLIMLTSLSVAWSVQPEVTGRRTIAIWGTTALGFYLAMRYKPEQILVILSWVFIVLALLSVGFVLFLPYYGVHWDNVHQSWSSI